MIISREVKTESCLGLDCIWWEAEKRFELTPGNAPDWAGVVADEVAELLVFDEPALLLVLSTLVVKPEVLLVDEPETLLEAETLLVELAAALLVDDELMQTPPLS